MKHLTQYWLLAWWVCASTVVFAADAPATRPAAGERSARRPVPASAEQDRSRKLMRDVFSAELADSSSSARQALARKLLGQSATMPDAPVDRFVMLDEAIQAAGEAGDLPLVFEAVDSMAEAYEVDGLAMKAGIALKVPPKVYAANESANTQAGLALLDLLESAEDFTTASQVVTLLGQVAVSDESLVTGLAQRGKDLDEMRQAREHMTQALEKLKTSPDDSAANLSVGTYTALLCGDWEHGLPLLANGDDPAVAVLAKAELADPAPAARANVASGWWDLAQAESGRTKANLLKRAMLDYWIAIPGLEGPERTLAEKRLAEASGAETGGAAAPSPDRVGDRAGSTIHLLPRIDARDIALAGWGRQDSELVSNPDDKAPLTLPYLAPDEYDLAIEFSRLADNGEIVLAFPVGRGTCDFAVGTDDNRHAWLGKIDGKWAQENPTIADASVPNNQQHRMEVKVRRYGVEGYLDGKRLCYWPTHGDDLMGTRDHMPRSPGLMTIGSWGGKAAFYSIDVTALHGAGAIARERDGDGWLYNPIVLKPAPDGEIKLSARDATVHGRQITYDNETDQQGLGTLEYWGSTDEYVTWFVDPLKAGDYTVEVTYACSDGEAGSKVNVGLDAAMGGGPGGPSLMLHVEDTDGWRQFRSATVGKLHLPAGRQTLSLKVKSKPQSYVMNLRQVLLVPTATAVASPGSATRPAGKPSEFYLLSQKNPENVPMSISVLTREIYRQGLLIAARDGVGLQTRDESLREWRGASPADATWNLVPSDSHMKITAGPGPAVWREEKSTEAWGPDSAFVRMAEIESLSRGDFVKLLEANGFSGTDNAIKPGAAAPADAEARLGQLEELSQFAVLRETHDLIRKDGESEARLGVLVRAYANLGQLTRFHWSIEHQVFAARSLLYAQRMVANDPKSAVALWHHAYAAAMAGFQAQALKDLDAAKPLGDEAKAPAWVPLLGPYCRYDLGKLSDLAGADASRAPLAMYLAFLTVEKSGCQAATLNTERAALDLNPKCLRLIDAMCNETGPGLLNQLVEVGPQVFSTTLGAELEKMPGLPQAVTQKIQELRRSGGNPEGRETICQSLIDLGSPENDPSELSCAALGRTIQETTFALARRKGDLIALQWGVDASGYVAEVQPLVQDHRFKGIIDAYGAFHDVPRHKAVAAMRSVRWEDLTMTELPLYWLEAQLQSRGGGSSNRLLTPFRVDMDFCSFDKEAWLAFYAGALRGKELDDVIRDLRSASPESPRITCNDILNHWDAAKAREWEKSHGGYPSIELALGKKYAQIGQWKDAASCFERYIKVSPDVTGYQALADVYKSQHQDDLWLATLRDFLERTEPIALEHAQVQQRIAEYYMARHQYTDAEPYADAAAGTGAAWGLQCAAKAHTGAGDFKRAEELLVEEYQHYSTSPYIWLAWCVGTGHGDRDAATRAFHDYIDARGQTLSSEDLFQTALVDAVEGKRAEAIATLNTRNRQAPGPLSLVHIVIFADEADDIAARDAALGQAEKLHDGNPLTLAFANELIKAYQGGPGTSLDLAAVDAILEKGNGTDRIEIPALTARYLMKHGNKDAAIKYVKRCYFGYGSYCADELLADQTSRDLGLDPLTLGNPPMQPAK